MSSQRRLEGACAGVRGCGRRKSLGAGVAATRFGLAVTVVAPCRVAGVAATRFGLVVTGLSVTDVTDGGPCRIPSSSDENITGLPRLFPEARLLPP